MIGFRGPRYGDIGVIIRRRPALQHEKASRDIQKMDRIDASASYIEEVKMSELAPPTHTLLIYTESSIF